MSRSNTYPSPLRDLYQLTGTGGQIQTWGLGGTQKFQFSDIPSTKGVLGRKLINYVLGIRLTFTATYTSTGGAAVPRKCLTPSLIGSVQVQGTEYGSPVSSSHFLGGIIDINSYIRNGCRNNVWNSPGLTLAAGVGKTITHTVDIMFANLCQRSGADTAFLALLMQPGEIVVSNPTAIQALHASLADVTISNCTVTAHAKLISRPEIIIANPYQLTRHKASANSGADVVQITSFGAASTLTGVQTKAGPSSILWAGSSLIGDAKGAGAVSALTQFSADFLGLKQQNSPRVVVQQMFEEVSDGNVIDVLGATTKQDIGNPIYPLFDLEAGTVYDLDIMSSAEVFPIMFPVRNFDASKLFDAVGNPSYNLNGTFSGSHYTYVDACYPLEMERLRSLLAIIQRNHIGLELYGTDDLVLDTKLDGNQGDLVSIANSDPSRLTYLPRRVIPAPKAA
jgi:hypothetical protein